MSDGAVHEKKYVSLYLENLDFPIMRAGWQVKKIFLHYTFKQKRFKKDCIILNQKSTQKAKHSIDKKFLTISNNSNFKYLIAEIIKEL